MAKVEATSDPGLISAIILAAGMSSRMRRPKHLLKLGGRTVLGRVVDTFIHSNVGEVLVVVGTASGIGRGELRGVKVIQNPESSMGVSTSIKAGLDAVRADSDAAVFGLADKPFVTVGTINSLIESYRASGRGIVIPIYRGIRGNPILFSREFFNELGGLSGDVGGKAVIKKHKERVLEVEVEDEGVLIDINTEKDYEKAKALFNQSRKRSPR